jgi:hypothetical protein
VKRNEQKKDETQERTLMLFCLSAADLTTVSLCFCSVGVSDVGSRNNCGHNRETNCEH